MFPGAGLSDEWRTRQFEYKWLRLAARHYADFWRVIEDAFVFATNKLKLRMSPESRSALMNSYLELEPWPDVVLALAWMKAAGPRLALLSNFTPTMLRSTSGTPGLSGMLDQVLSTADRIWRDPDQSAEVHEVTPPLRSNPPGIFPLREPPIYRRCNQRPSPAPGGSRRWPFRSKGRRVPVERGKYRPWRAGRQSRCA